MRGCIFVYVLCHNGRVNIIDRTLDRCRVAVRALMERLAVFLNRSSRGRLTPAMVTLTSVFAHVPVAWLIAEGHFLVSAPLLLMFGLLDALDGALARVQKKASPAGMLLDATTDRMKEIILYSGIAIWFIHQGPAEGAVWAVIASGGSLLVSYVKAKGETAVASANLSHTVVNRMFQDGLLRFEVRMALLIIGLLANQLLPVVVIIALLSWWTAIDRLITISRRLHGANR